MTDYHAPETALLDLDWLLDQASLFITSHAVDCEMESRIHDYTKVSGCSIPVIRRGDRSAALELHSSAPAALGMLRQEVRRYLAHESVEEIYDAYLDRMAKLELVCRKEEVSRRIARTLDEFTPRHTRRAA